MVETNLAQCNGVAGAKIISANVLRLGGRFNAAKPLLYAGTVD